MSKGLLNALAADVFRLVAAGLGAGVGLTRRAAELRSVAAKVPVLNPLANAVVQTADAAPADAPRPLLDLIVLMGQTRSALVGNGVGGRLIPLLPSGPWGASFSVEELTAWRHDLQKRPSKACQNLTKRLEAGEPCDLRLWNLLPNAVPQVYGSDSSRLTPRKLPSWVAPLLPNVQIQYDPTGDGGDDRRLSLLCRLDPALGLQLCREALDGNFHPVQQMAARWLPKLAEPGEVLARFGPLVGELPRAMVSAVALALARTGPSLIPRLLDLLRSPSDAWWQASMVLKEVAPYEPNALRPHAPCLLEVLDLADGRTFNKLVQTLAALRPLPEDPTPRLLALLPRLPGPGPGMGNRVLRWDALRALAALGFRWKLARSTVLQIARTDPDTWTRRDAQRCLAVAAAAGEPEAAAALVELLGDAPNYCPSVATMFDDLGPAGAMTVPGLIEVIQGTNASLRVEAMRALVGLGVVALPAAKAVVARAHAGAEDAAFAVRVLGTLGAAVPDGVRLILAALDSPQFNTRWHAWLALELYRPRSAIPPEPLIPKLSATDAWVRGNAAQFLGRCGSAARSAVPALHKALGDSDKTVQKAVRKALERIQ